jgi:hypothetical protein
MSEEREVIRLPQSQPDRPNLLTQRSIRSESSQRSVGGPEKKKQIKSKKEKAHHTIRSRALPKKPNIIEVSGLRGS